MQGMAIEFPNSKYVYLDNLTGNFSTTRTINSTEIDKKVYSYLFNIFNSQLKASENETNNLTQNNDNVINNETNRLQNEISPLTIKQALRLIKNIIYLKFNVEIKSFDYLF